MRNLSIKGENVRIDLWLGRHTGEQTSLKLRHVRPSHPEEQTVLNSRPNGGLIPSKAVP
jgi:hypothetical protein